MVAMSKPEEALTDGEIDEIGQKILPAVKIL